MTTLADLRTDLTDALRDGGLDAHGHLPERIQPPVVLVEPGEPYLTDEPDHVPAGHLQVAYDLHVIGRQATAAEQTRRMDDLITTALDALDTTQWAPGDVARPYTLTVGSASYLATRITVTTIARLT